MAKYTDNQQNNKHKIQVHYWQPEKKDCILFLPPPPTTLTI